MNTIARTALAVASAAALASAASAQTAIPAPATPVANGSAPSLTPAMLHIPEGTEFTIRFNDDLSSASSTIGDRFTITSEEPVQLANGQTLPAGLVGAGEVTSVKKKGMMGQAGDLNVRLDYLKVGASRVHLRGSQGGAGNGAVGSTIALTVLFGPLGLLKHGHDAVIHKGQHIKAYADQDIDVPVPTVLPAST